MKVSSLLSFAAFLNYLLPVSAVSPVTNFKCWNKVISCAIMQEAIDREYDKMKKPSGLYRVRGIFSIAPFHIKYSTRLKVYDVTINVAFTEWKQVEWMKAIVDGREYGCEPTDELENCVVWTGPGRYQ
ncbi:BgTH12-06344 [Blumeria graminis f. sp. triticale]|uniref:BgTH12-06344 n=1 Tax=Blumeria graminis f. sp. triticale TaxID=1689686 RepID=A0A9W4CXG9_BLUGR|nr:BgTH12-06344 [Blumeria graminis f. sp. triticale]